MSYRWTRIALLSSLSLALAQPSPGQDPSAGVYTVEQAGRGRTVYATHCANCHGRTLVDGDAAQLAGKNFIGRWNQGTIADGGNFRGWGAGTVDDLFFILRTTMPQGAQGTLSTPDYLAVLALILQRNGYEPGETPLTDDPTLLASIPIEWRGDAVAAARVEPPQFIRGSEGMEPTDPDYLPSSLLAGAHENSQDWLYHTHDYTGRRFVDLDEINAGNAAKLQVVCAFQFGDLSNFQTGPIVYQGTMYMTTLHQTVAINAATCRLKWRSVWEPRDVEVWRNNRGVAVAQGRVFRGTADGYLLALDATDGRLLWARKAANTAEGETFTMAPMIYDDLLIIGPAGSENAISGWVGAFRLADGEPVWRFKTVPGAREAGDASWGNPLGLVLGGGAVWTPFSLDTESEELYVAVTNPAPDFPAEAARPGENLFSNSIVALDVRSGNLRWYKQLVPADYHDWDLTQVSPLYDATIDGRRRQLVATAGKDGLLRVLDRDSHQQIFEAEVTTRENVDAPITPEGVHACPGMAAGVLWNGPAYSSRTQMLYVSAVDLCSTFYVAEELRYIPGQMFLGGSVTMDATASGRLSAIDSRDGSLRWRYDSPMPLLAAVTVTSGDVLFTAELTGDFLAFDARSGEELYRFNTGGPMGAGIVTYAVDGRQYVAAMSGRPSPGWAPLDRGSPTAMVFALPASE